MKVRAMGRFFVIGGILASLIAGCGVTVSLKTNGNATPTPTQSIEVKMTQAALVEPTLTQSATVQPSLTQTATVQPTLAQTATVQPILKEYTSKGNSYSLSYPADWNVAYEDLVYAGFEPTDKSGLIYVSVANTGYELDAALFTAFVSAYETNRYFGNKNYKEVKRDILPDENYALVTKTLDKDKIPWKIGTLYTKIGKVIYIQSYQSTDSTASNLGPVFEQVAKSFKSNPAYAEDFTPYSTSTLSYSDPKDLFTIKVPDSWTYKDLSTKALNSFAAISPDGHGVIIIQEKDLGKAVTRPVADAEALRLIKAIDIDARIATIEIFKDGTKGGTTQWNWAPKNGLFQAVSLHKGNGTVFHMVTFIIDKGFEFYQSTMNDLMTNYYKVTQ
jgi:hypothetical protein